MTLHLLDEIDSEKVKRLFIEIVEHDCEDKGDCNEYCNFGCIDDFLWSTHLIFINPEPGLLLMRIYVFSWSFKGEIRTLKLGSILLKPKEIMKKELPN